MVFLSARLRVKARIPNHWLCLAGFQMMPMKINYHFVTGGNELLSLDQQVRINMYKI